MRDDFAKVLFALREIGWRCWDPIDLVGLGVAEKVSDEYVTYLLAAASKLFNGVPSDRVVNYLVRCETVTIGVKGRQDAQARAAKTIEEVLDLLHM